MNYNCTKHFEARARQRGTPWDVTEAVQVYGEIARDHRKGKNKQWLPGRSSGSGHYRFFSHRSLAQMERDGLPKSLIEEARKKMHFRWVVANDSGTLVTVMAMHKNKQRIWN